MNKIRYSLIKMIIRIKIEELQIKENGHINKKELKKGILLDNMDEFYTSLQYRQVEQNKSAKKTNFSKVIKFIQEL